ncbi:MAG: DUF1761 domain-containing protein [Flavisolibacter sp.]|jgi:hypothetical protein|nr:DUF1761 domain-containing protein [Flavisolibacter sp.]
MDTSIFSEINWLAVLVAAVLYFALGALWYTALFGKQWIAYQGINVNDPEMKKGSGAIMLSSFFLMLFATICLALLVEKLELNQAVSGIKLGLVTGLGFAFTAISISYLYIKKPFGLHAIDGLYHVVGQIIAAIVLCLWK